jgi:transposase InsO family protein
MGQHGSARLSVHSRRLIAVRVLDEGWSLTAAAQAAGVCRQTATKWLDRFVQEGEAGLRDRTCRPHRCRPMVPERVVAKIRRLRTRRLGSHAIAYWLGIARSTVHKVLVRLGLGRLAPVQPKPTVRRYEWDRPGQMIHVDTKKLGRIKGIGKRFGGPRSPRKLGWDVVHIAVDDHSRLAYVEVQSDELGITAAAFMGRAIDYFGSHGIAVARVLSDNGSPYRSSDFAGALADHGIRHRFTKPYHPQTNGKAEAMVKILLNGWAYARPYRSSAERTRALERFMRFYNHERPHGGLGGQRPIDRVR